MFESNIIRFTLKQITPIIHFKGEEGTLRGSDLKPRFDKFLHLVIDEKETESYLLKRKNSEINEDNSIKKGAFDYKLKITKSEKRDFKGIKTYIDEKNKIKGAYFGNKTSLSFYKSITVEFIVKEKGLTEYIKNWFPKFIVFNTFGTRKNKGYGYFIPEKIEIAEKKEEYEVNYKYLLNSIKQVASMYKHNGKEYLGIYQIESGSERGNKVVVDLIKEFHQILKSGINSKSYMPSIMLKKYNILSNSCNEKKGMKILLKKQGIDISKLTKNLKENISGEFPKNKYFIRTLLGFAPYYDFRGISHGKFTLTNCDENGKSTAEIFDRFESPIQYIPIPRINFPELKRNMAILVVDYKKIEEFRKNRLFIFRNDICEENEVFKVPTEEEYSIRKIFGNGGILCNSKNYSEYFNYKVLHDIQEYPVIRE
ncbi:MAG: hypothetical protein HUJ88_11120 [Fusobacterium necrophorum]|nr:hypothetical protein [Fusobacterium necrophorum]